MRRIYFAQLLMMLASVGGGAIIELPARATETRTDQATVAAVLLDWQRPEDAYQPPDFAAYFPDSERGAAALAALWAAPDRDARPRAEVLTTVREGLRRFEGNPMPVLHWVGNQYIWNQTPQDVEAIELMYHAADPAGAPREILGAAIYFGLSTVRPMSPAIQRTLMEIAVGDDDPNNLSRIAWGLGEQRNDALRYLEPFHASPDPAVREKSAVVEQIMERTLKAFEWAQEKARQRAEIGFGKALPRILQVLSESPSADRLRTLALIEREGLMLIMDDSHIAVFAQCAEDPDPGVRRQVARMAGQRWVWSVEEPAPEAVDLMVALSHDADRETRYNAVYFGLSTIHEKNERLVRRLLEIALNDREPNLYQRIAWGLRTQRDLARAVLDSLIAGNDAARAAAAREVYLDMGGRASQ